MPVSKEFHPSKAILELGDGFADAAIPAEFPMAKVRYRNRLWAEREGLGDLDDDEWVARFARFEPFEGSLAEPLALRYHGHQFRVYNPAIGDGRGFLYAQMIDPVDGRLLDFGTKGSGRTPWSRGADGRLTLKGGVREVLATEMLEALGVETSKSFSMIETGEALQRGDEPSPTRSSVLVRLSHSHLRIGTFQRLANLGDAARLERLVDYAIEHYFPTLRAVSKIDRPRRLLGEVARRAAELASSWMVAGFVHGVLNSDNINITGESFDYGPYRFLPRYDRKFVAAYFDETGLYAYGRQVETMKWNLERLAESLTGISPDPDRLRSEIGDFEPRTMMSYHARFLDRLGVLPIDPISDSLLVSRCECFLESTDIGFDRFFFDWFGGLAAAPRAKSSPVFDKYSGEKWRAMVLLMNERAPARPDLLSNAYFSRKGPTSLLIDEIESIWSAIAERDDWTAFAAKIEDIQTMGAVFGRGPAPKVGPSG